MRYILCLRYLLDFFYTICYIDGMNNAYKYSSPKQVALGGLFFSFLIIDFILIFVFSLSK